METQGAQRIKAEPNKGMRYIMLDKSTEIILKNGSQKQIDELQKQLTSVQSEVKALKSYTKLKETQILLLQEMNSNEQ